MLEATCVQVCVVIAAQCGQARLVSSRYGGRISGKGTDRGVLMAMGAVVSKVSTQRRVRYKHRACSKRHATDVSVYIGYR